MFDRCLLQAGAALSCKVERAFCSTFTWKSAGFRSYRAQYGRRGLQMPLSQVGIRNGPSLFQSNSDVVVSSSLPTVKAARQQTGIILKTPLEDQSLQHLNLNSGHAAGRTEIKVDEEELQNQRTRFGQCMSLWRNSSIEEVPR